MRALTRGDDAYGLMAAAAPSHVPGRFTSDVALFELAVAALDLACPPGAEPLEYERLRDRYLPEVGFHCRVEHRNSQYALYAAACMQGGLQPYLLSDAGWWQTPLWQYAVLAVVVYSRAAAEQVGVPLDEIARRIAVRHHLDPSIDGERVDRHGEVTTRPVRGHDGGPRYPSSGLDLRRSTVAA